MKARTADVMSRAVRELSRAEVAALCDRDLLRRFLAAADQAAFTALVDRHAKMVLGVCKQILHTHHDAEDACQAVFLILARKAAGTRWQTSIANWLYTTARKVAHNARRTAARRIKREGRAAKPEAVAAVDLMTGRELAVVLFEELDRLAPCYREPLVLCYLEGLTRDEAAVRAGVPDATLKSQLERGRKKLADALTARGCTFSAALLATAAAATTEASSPMLVETILAAVSGPPSEAVAALAKGGAVNGIFRKTTLVLLTLTGIGAVGLGFAALPPPPASPGPTEAPPAAEKKDAAAAKPAAGAAVRTFTGKVLGTDGKPVAGAKLYYCFRDRGTTEIPVRATTDQDGRYSFMLSERDIPNTVAAVGDDAVSGGFVVAKAEGRTWAWEGVRPATSEVVLTCAADTTPVRGRILDQQGKPIAGARVIPLGAAAPEKGDLAAFLKSIENGEPAGLAMRKHTPNDWRDFFATSRPSPLLPATTTDAEGRFRLDGYAADRIVELRLEGETIETKDVFFVSGKPAPIPAPKPGAGIGGGALGGLGGGGGPPGLFAAPVLKANGDDYAAGPGLVVTGIVRDAESGKPVPGAIVEMYRNAIHHTTTGADGRYRLSGLRPVKSPEKSDEAARPLPFDGGTPAIRVRSTGDVPLLPVVKTIPETKPAVPTVLDVALPRGVWVEISTVDRATGKPLAGSVSYYPAPEIPKVPLTGGPGLARLYDPTIPVPTDGKLRLAVIPDRAAVLAFSASPGRLDLSKFPIAADAAKRERMGGLAPSNFHAFADVNPKAGSDPVAVRFTLDSSRRVEGKLTGPDGKPVSGVLATGLLHDWYNSPMLPLRSAEFAVLGVEAGQSRLVCFYQPELKLGGSVVVRGGEKGPLLVKLQPTASVRGRLIDDAGQPVKQARLGFVELPLPRTGDPRSTETGVLIRDRLGPPSSRLTTIKKDGTVTTTELGPEMKGLRLNSINRDGSVTTTSSRLNADPVTDADGRFTISGLIPGLKYHLVWRDGRARPDDWKGLVSRDLVFEPGQDKDVGEVKSKPLAVDKK